MALKETEVPFRVSPFCGAVSVTDGVAAPIVISWLLIASMLPALSIARYLTVVVALTVNAVE